MRRWSFFIYGVFAHLLFFAVYAYMAGFVGNFGVPKSIDSTPENNVVAIVIDLLLILMFGLQHSIMARPGFKRVWTRWVPEPIERSTYVLISNVASFILMWQWRGVDIVVWNVQSPVWRGVLWGLFVAGWLMVPSVSFMINHFDLFGTRQVWLYLKGEPYKALPFRTPLLYGRIRHPLYVGWALAFWATPTMTAGHMLFAGTMTLYMVIAARIEERDLVRVYGHLYRMYQDSVPAFVPRFCKTDPSLQTTPKTLFKKPATVRNGSCVEDC